MAPRNVILACAILLWTGAAHATDYFWTNPAGGNFAGNFTPGGTPLSAIDTRLFFPDLLALPTGYTATNNLGSFTLNAMGFQSFGSNNPAAVTVSAGAAAGFTLRFAANGAIQPSIMNNGNGSVAVQNGLAATGITIVDGANLMIGGTGLGNLALAATIGQTGGAGSVTYQSAAPFTPGYGSIVTISGASTYSGGTSIVSGNINIASASSLPFTSGPFGTGPVTINGTDHLVRMNTSGTLANSFVLNQSLQLGFSIVTATFSGAMSGSSGLTFGSSDGNILNTSSGSFTFTGVGTATGPLNIGDGRGSGRVIAFASATGTTRYSSFSVDPTNVLTFDNRTATATRVNPALPPPLVLRSSTVSILGQTGGSAAASETFDLLTVSGSSLLSGTPGTSSPVTLRFAGLARELNATLDFRGTNLGSSGNNTANFVFTSDPGGSVGGILPYAVASTSVTGSSRTLARYDGATGRIVPLNVATDFNPVDLYVAGQSNPEGNFRRAGTVAAPNAGGAAGLVGAITANALVLEETSVAGSATLTVASGCLVQSASFSSSIGYLNLGGLNFGSSPAYIHSLVHQVINAPISGTGGIIKSGEGTLTLTKANSFSGGLTINAGAVNFSSDSALGSASNGITLNVADVSGSDDNAGLIYANNLIDPSPVTTMTTTRSITVGPVGGNLNVDMFNGTWTINSPITGSGPLRIGRGPFGSTGVVVLNGTNSNTGRLNIEGNLAVASDASLGAPGASLRVAGEGSLRVDGSFATSRAVILSGTVIVPAGRSLQLNGPVTGTRLDVVGAGELAITSTSAFTGFVRVGDENLDIRLFSPLPAGIPSGATLTLRGPNGAMPLVGQSTTNGFQVAQGGTIHLDNSGPAGNVNPNRIGNTGFILAGGELKLTGNASVDVMQSMGNLISDQYLGTVTLDQPDSGGASRRTALVSPVNLRSTDARLRDVLFVRGTNLGATTGDRTAFLLNTDPSTTNGLIEAVVVATSATGSPTDFAASTPVGTQFSIAPFTAYAGPVPASGGAATATYDNTNVSVVTGNVATNALRLSANGGVQMNAGTTLSLETGMILALPNNVGISGGAINTSKAFRVINSGDLTIGTAAAPTTISASNGFTKAGPGRLTLFGTPSTTLGNVTGQRATVSIAEGTLALGNSRAVVNASVNGVTGALPDFWIDSRGTLDLSALSSPVRVRGLYGHGNLQLGAAGIQLGDFQSRLAGNLVGPASATFSVGTPQSEAPGNTFGSEVRLAGDNSGFAGSFAVLRGTLALSGSLSAGSGTSPILIGDTSGSGQANLSIGPGLTLTRDIIVRAGATPATPHMLIAGGGVPSTASSVSSNQTVTSNIVLGQTLQIADVSSDATLFFTGTISGAGGLQQSGIDAIFTGDNTYSGGFTSGFGFIGIGSNSTATTGPFGTGQLRIGTSGGGTFLAHGGPRTISNPISTTGTTGFMRINGLNDLTFTGTVNYSTLTQPFQLISNNAGVTTFAGAISGSRQLQKQGPGTVVFSSPTGNAYTGGTLVDAGTLIAANTSGSATGTGVVTVNPGAILGGNGIIAGNTTITTGGIIRPGANETTPGTLMIGGNVTLQDRAILSVTLDGSNGGKVQLTGGFFDLTGANSLTVFVTGAAPATPQSFTIIDSGAIPIAFFNGAFSAANFAVSANFPFGSLSLSSPTPTTLVLNYVPVPEPAGVIFVAGVAWVAQRVFRRKPVGQRMMV